MGEQDTGLVAVLFGLARSPCLHAHPGPGGLGRDPGFCVSDELPGNVAGPGPHFDLDLSLIAV